MADRLAEIKAKWNGPLGMWSADDSEWLITEVERLEAAATPYSSDTLALMEADWKREAFERAAKIKPQEPAGMRRGDPAWEAGWHRGVQDFRSALRKGDGDG